MFFKESMTTLRGRIIQIAIRMTKPQRRREPTPLTNKMFLHSPSTRTRYKNENNYCAAGCNKSNQAQHICRWRPYRRRNENREESKQRWSQTRLQRISIKTEIGQQWILQQSTQHAYG